MTDSNSNELDDLVDKYREDILLARDGFDSTDKKTRDKAVSLAAYASINFKTALEKLLADRENRARIDELNLVLHSGDSANSPRWTHENVKDRIKALSPTKSDPGLALDKPSVRTEDNNQERSQ